MSPELTVLLIKPTQQKLVAMPTFRLEGSGNNFIYFIYSYSFTVRATLVKISPVDVEIIGLAEIGEK